MKSNKKAKIASHAAKGNLVEVVVAVASNRRIVVTNSREILMLKIKKQAMRVIGSNVAKNEEKNLAKSNAAAEVVDVAVEAAEEVVLRAIEQSNVRDAVVQAKIVPRENALEENVVGGHVSHKTVSRDSRAERPESIGKSTSRNRGLSRPRSYNPSHRLKSLRANSQSRPL